MGLVNFRTDGDLEEVAAASATTLALAAPVSENASQPTTIFSFVGLANKLYLLDAVLTGAADSSNLGILLGMSLPTGATSVLTFHGPIADNNVLVTGTANDSGIFSGTGNWLGGQRKAMIRVMVSVKMGTVDGTVALQFQKSGSGTFTIYRPSLLTYRAV